MEFKDGEHNREPVLRRNQGPCWKYYDLRKEEGEPQRPRGVQPSRQLLEVKSRLDLLLHGRRPGRGARPLRGMQLPASRRLLSELWRRVPGGSQPRGSGPAQQAKDLLCSPDVGQSTHTLVLLALDAAAKG